MYKIFHTYDGKEYVHFRKTAKQAINTIRDWDNMGYKDIGMIKLSRKEINEMKRQSPINTETGK